MGARRGHGRKSDRSGEKQGRTVWGGAVRESHKSGGGAQSVTGTQVSHGAVQISHGAVQVSHVASQVSHGAVQVSHGAVQVSHGAVQVSHGATKVRGFTSQWRGVHRSATGRVGHLSLVSDVKIEEDWVITQVVGQCLTSRYVWQLGRKTPLWLLVIRHCHCTN